MTTLIRGLSVSFVFVLAWTTVGQAQWVFLARKGLQVIQNVTTQVQGAVAGPSHGAAAATVMLAVPADRVYGAAMKMIRENPDVQVLWQDESKQAVGFAKGNLSGSLKVTSLADNLSQILVASSSADASGTALVVDRIMQVCRHAGVECAPE